MALRNQPYFPLYVQDFLTDEKLIECSAESTGVYIRLLCLMHKSDEYGTVLLKQKYKQTESTCLNFAYMIAKQMPYSEDVVNRSLEELLQEGVLLLEDDKLIQKRMVKDNELSLVRSKAGSTGGKVAQAKVKANIQANTEYENEDEYAYVIKSKEALRNWKWYEEEKFIEWLESKKEKMDVNAKSRFNTEYINSKKDAVIFHCESKGVKYKNYRATIQNWINSDISGGKFQ